MPQFIEKATQEVAEAGTNDYVMMTPLKTKQQLQSLGVKGDATGLINIYSSTSSVNYATSLNVVVIGEYAVNAGATITDSVFIGAQCGRNITGGNGTVAIGNLSMNTQVTSQHNTCIGDSTGRLIATGGGNTIMGYIAGSNLVTSNGNTIIGWYAGAYTETGDNNTLIGSYAGAHSEVSGTNIGEYNLGIGYSSLQFCQGDYNIGLGKEALYNVTGDHNIGIGDQTGLTVVAGSNNIFIGQDAGNSTGVQKITAQNTICIGNGTYSTVDNEVVLGNASVTKTTLRGNVEGVARIDFTLDSSDTLPTNGAITRWASYLVLNADANGLLVANANNATWLLQVGPDGKLTTRPPASATPASNGEMVFELTSNTTLTIKVKGSDGTVRSGTITLS